MAAGSAGPAASKQRLTPLPGLQLGKFFSDLYGCGWTGCHAMPKIGIAALFAAVNWLAATPSIAAAQSFEERFRFAEKTGGMISDTSAQLALQTALKRISQARCNPPGACAPPNPRELANPPINTGDARAAMVVAVRTAMAEWCGLDARRSFLQMLAFAQNEIRMTDRQVALLSIIHDDFRRLQLSQLQKGETCPPEFRAELDAHLNELE